MSGRVRATNSSVTWATSVVRRHAADEEQRRQRHADLDRLRQVGEDRQRQRHHPHAGVGQAGAEDVGDLRPVAHVPRDHQQDRGQHRHRHQRGERRRPQHDRRAASARGRCRRPASSRPARTLVAVRAIAPVAGSPPKSGEAMLATPCATSSTFGLWRSPVIRSATIADISDSMPPSIATVNAGGSRPSTRSSAERGDRRTPASRSGCRGSACRSSPPAGPACAPRAVPATSATIVPGMRVFSVAQRISASSVHTPSAGGRRIGRRQRAADLHHAADEVVGHPRHGQAEELAQLRAWR